MNKSKRINYFYSEMFKNRHDTFLTSFGIWTKLQLWQKVLFYANHIFDMTYLKQVLDKVTILTKILFKAKFMFDMTVWLLFLLNNWIRVYLLLVDRNPTTTTQSIFLLFTTYNNIWPFFMLGSIYTSVYSNSYDHNVLVERKNASIKLNKT